MLRKEYFVCGQSEIKTVLEGRGSMQSWPHDWWRTVCLDPGGKSKYGATGLISDLDYGELGPNLHRIPAYYGSSLPIADFEIHYFLYLPGMYTRNHAELLRCRRCEVNMSWPTARPQSTTTNTIT